MSDQGDYAENARRQRETPNVLRLRALQIWSGRPDATIFIFEGFDDVAPYEVWLKTLAEGLQYVPLPGSGKTQVLAFAEQVCNSDEFRQSLYFFVDRDFDGLRGIDPNPSIFCTAAYSVENYLCTPEVLKSILIDDFRLAGRQSVIDSVLELFRCVTEQYIRCMRQANLRLYCGTSHALRNGNVENRIRRYLKIEYGSVEPNSDSDLSSLIPLKRDPTAEELVEAERFLEDALLSAGRGKFLLGFFLVWLEEVEKAFRNKTLIPCDGLEVSAKFRRNEFNLRNLATRATPPVELREFVQTNIAAS